MSNEYEKISQSKSEKDRVNIELTPKKGPLSFFSGAVTSFVLGWLCLGLSQRLIIYFTIHSPKYSSPIAQNIASGFKTLVIGVSFLATFTFLFIGLGLVLVFIRSLLDVKSSDAA